MARYLIASGPMQTTASFATQTTGTSILTLLQFKPSATITAKVSAFGVSFDASAAATPGKIELIETDVAATVTAAVAADITKLDSDALAGGDPTTNLIVVGTSATGYTASAEGSITSVRNLAGPRLIAPSNEWSWQWPLGQEPTIQVSKFARIRVKFGTAVNCYAWMEVII